MYISRKVTKTRFNFSYLKRNVLVLFNSVLVQITRKSAEIYFSIEISMNKIKVSKKCCLKRQKIIYLKLKIYYSDTNIENYL